MYKIGTMLPVLARTLGKKEQTLAFLSLLAYIQKALCRHRRKNDRKVISIVLVAEGTGFDTRYLPFCVL